MKRERERKHDERERERERERENMTTEEERLLQVCESDDWADSLSSCCVSAADPAAAAARKPGAGPGSGPAGLLCRTLPGTSPSAPQSSDAGPFVRRPGARPEEHKQELLEPCYQPEEGPGVPEGGSGDDKGSIPQGPMLGLNCVQEQPVESLKDRVIWSRERVWVRKPNFKPHVPLYGFRRRSQSKDFQKRFFVLPFSSYVCASLRQFVRSIIVRTPSILNKECVDRRPRTERSPVALKHHFDPTGLVQRCVIIQRDENGFGLTVSGDNPVFVQLVKEDGAAMRAGVQTGDRIIKVNGTLVTHSNHIEVVKLIKSGSYVALTVLGRPPGLPHLPLDDELCPLSPCPLCTPLSCREGAGAGVRCPRNENSQSDSPLRADTQPDIQVTRADSADDTRPSPAADTSPTSHSSGDSGLQSSVSTADTSPTSHSSGDGGLQSSVLSSTDTPSSAPEDRRSEGHTLGTAGDSEDTHTQAGPSPPHLLQPHIIGAEDDYFEPEQINGQCSIFQSIDQLKTRPAHLSVFLHHVVSQFDPAPLLCFLFAELHKQTSAKESRRFFLEFHSLFLDRAANLKVPVPEAVAAELEIELELYFLTPKKITEVMQSNQPRLIC
ncbi:hypothetical protein WMY93_008322 [Mugilogobius chulae]|uniref:PDZ domain-containing protein n=1 Tax=Mugilogobius chulae TaxID=88201 RepID=A0AAW0PIP1_9GOBI